MLDELQAAVDALVVKIRRGLEMNARSGSLTGYRSKRGKSPMEELTELLLDFAERLGASDIHFEPQTEHMRIRFRINGKLVEVSELPQEAAGYFVSYLKLTAGMDIAEKRTPQDGSILYEEKSMDIRVSAMPVLLGEKIVLRLLGSERKLLPLTKMGFSARNLNLFKNIIHSVGGIVTITGPVNSGKTTLLYSALNYLNKESVNIVTIEDPVELKINGINQTQVNVKAGLDFAAGLRAVLRQDPDILMIGEIRDSAAAQEAIRAALTGRLVLTTLHTSNAMGVPARLLDMGVNPSALSIALLASTAQRLVRTICPGCKEAYVPAENSLESLLIGGKFYRGMTLYRGRGCRLCRGSGYSGRTAIQEIMTADDNIRALIAKKDVNLKLKRMLRLKGMKTMLDDGIEKVLSGVTTAQEVWSVLNGVYEFEQIP